MAIRCHNSGHTWANTLLLECFPPCIFLSHWCLNFYLKLYMKVTFCCCCFSENVEVFLLMSKYESLNPTEHKVPDHTWGRGSVFVGGAWPEEKELSGFPPLDRPLFSSLREVPHSVVPGALSLEAGHLILVLAKRFPEWNSGILLIQRLLFKTFKHFKDFQ